MFCKLSVSLHLEAYLMNIFYNMKGLVEIDCLINACFAHIFLSGEIIFQQMKCFIDFEGSRPYQVKFLYPFHIHYINFHL